MLILENGRWHGLWTQVRTALRGEHRTVPRLEWGRPLLATAWSRDQRGAHKPEYLRGEPCLRVRHSLNHPPRDPTAEAVGGCQSHPGTVPRDETGMSNLVSFCFPPMSPGNAFWSHAMFERVTHTYSLTQSPFMSDHVSQHVQRPLAFDSGGLRFVPREIESRRTE